MEGARWCCPYCCSWMPEGRFAAHIEPCARRHSVLQTALGFTPCEHDDTHVVLTTDTATHAARCNTPCPAALRSASTASTGLPCRGCGASVPVTARRCAWCGILRPWAFVARQPGAAPPAVRADERLARAVAVVQEAVREAPEDFPALRLALTDPVRVAHMASEEGDKKGSDMDEAESNSEDEDEGESESEDESEECTTAAKRRRDALDDPGRAPWLLEVIHRADMRNVRAREALDAQEEQHGQQAHK